MSFTEIVNWTEDSQQKFRAWIWGMLVGAARWRRSARLVPRMSVETGRADRGRAPFHVSVCQS